MRSALWSRLHSESERWATSAHEEFLAGLSPDAATAALARREVMVAVYGPTQVGKTTLILTLLGVAEGDAFREVEHVLRGGSPRGRSATAVPMRYSRSEDDAWRIGSPDTPALDAEGITARLGDLRAAVVAGRHEGTDPLKLFIPVRLFTRSDPPARVSLLDLPGIHAAAPHERELVGRIVERHVPAATLVLLVSNADNLGVFDPEKLRDGLDELRDWMESKERYRLVTTRSYSPNSVRRERQQAEVEGHVWSATDVRASLLRELGRFEEIGDARSLEKLQIYPLEFGDSWEGLRRSEPGHHAWAEQVQHVVRAELLADIDESCRSDRRLDIGRDVARQARRRRTTLANEYREAMSELRNARSSTLADRDDALRACGHHERRLRDQQNTLGRLSALRSDVAKTVSRHLAAIGLEGAPDPKLSALSTWLDDAVASLNQGLIGLANEYRKDHRLALDLIHRPVCKELDAVRDRLGGYGGFLDGYWPSISGKFERDLADARSAIVAFKQACVAKAERDLEEFLRRAVDETQVARDRTQQRLRSVESHLVDANRRLKEIHERRARERRDYLPRLKVARMDKHRADRFDGHMREARDEEAKRIVDTVWTAAASRSSAEVLARLCQLRLTHQFHRNRCTSTSG